MTINKEPDVGNIMINMTRIIVSPVLIIVCAVLISCSASYGADKLDPFNAKFGIIETQDKSKFDISVKLDFSIHNIVEGKLNGSKFLCNEDIDSLTVTDQTGKRLLYTVKAYPRKKLIWEYPEPLNGVRRVKISFMIRDAVKLSKGQYIVNIDWLGGWKRKVLNSSYQIDLPSVFSEKDIVTVFPDQYKIQKSGDRIRINHKLSDASSKGLKVVLKKNQLKKVIPEKTDSVKNKIKKSVLKNKEKQPEKSAVLKRIRYAKHSKKSDRIIFELNKVVPFEIDYKEAKDEVELKWKTSLIIEKSLLKQKKIDTQFIAGYNWKKIRNKQLVSVIKLKKKNMRVKYGSLNNPSRVYLDLSIDTRKTKPVKIKKDLKKTSKIREKQKKSSEVPQIIKSKLPPENKSLINTKDMPEEKIRMTLTVPDNLPIEEKILYKNAGKLFNSGEYERSIAAYKDLMIKFPNTSLKENLLYHIADATYKIGESKDQKSYTDAINAYQNAISNFPDSKSAPFGLFQIAEFKRKENLTIESMTQYAYFVEKYPNSKYVAVSRYWIAELNYQMKKYKDALKAFETFIKDYKSGPYLKESYFRIGDCYLKFNDFDRAEYFYEKAFKKWPEITDLSSESLNNIAITYYYKGRFKKSRNMFMLSFNRFPDQEGRDMLLRYCADSYQWEGDMQKALDLYGLQAEIFPESDETKISIMRIADIGVNVSGLDGKNCFFKDFNPYHNPEKAYRWLLDNDDTQKTWTEAYYKIGFLKAKGGKYETALRYFKKSMNQEGTGVYYKKSIENIRKMLVNLIDQAADRKDHLRVIDLYSKNKEIFLQPVDDCVFLNRVVVSYIEYGFLGSAEELLKDISTDSDQAGCRHKATVSLAAIDIERDQYSKASDKMKILLYGGEYLDQQIEEEAHHLLGDACFNLKEYQDAVSAYTQPLKKVEIDEKNFNSVLQLGKSFGKLGYYYNGIHELNRYIDLMDKSSLDKVAVDEFKENAMLLIVNYLHETKNYSAAVNILKKIEDTTKSKDVKLIAGLKISEILLESDKYDDSIKQYEEVANKGPYNFYGNYAISKLNDMKWNLKNSETIKEFL